MTDAHNPYAEPEDTETQEDRKARLENEVKGEIGDIVWLMSNKRGRRIVRRLLDQAGVYQLSYTGEALSTAFNEGRRSAGNKLIAIVAAGEIDITGTSVVHCVDSTFSYAGGGKFVSLGGTGEFHGLRCLFDGATQSGTYATAMVIFGAGTTGSLAYCKFVNAPISHFLSFAIQADLEDCFFGMCGQDPIGGDDGTHLELIRNDRGVMNVTRCFFDLRDYKIELPPNPPSRAGWTGIGFHETNATGAQDIEVNYRDCIFLGCTLQELLYVFQGGAKYLGYNVTMTFNNCVIEPGEGAFVGVAEDATGQVIVSGTGNVTDLGVPIINLEGAPP
ncbi:MAG: hypothetical protein V4820_11555 [Pseudomonadota bacterium]